MKMIAHHFVDLFPSSSSSTRVCLEHDLALCGYYTQRTAHNTLTRIEQENGDDEKGKWRVETEMRRIRE